MTTYFPRGAQRFSKSNCLLTVAAGLLLAGCSQAVDRFASKSSDKDPAYTASVPSPDGDDKITSSPLAGSGLRKPGSKYAYKKPAYRKTQVASADDAPVATSDSVTVEPGMTLYSIAKANNLTISELAAANGIRPPYSVRTGQTLQIPGGSEAVAPNTRPAMAQGRSKTRNMHQVESGETLFSLGRKFGVSPYAIADLNGLDRGAMLSLGQPVKIPGGADAVAAVDTEAAPRKKSGKSPAKLVLSEEDMVETGNDPAAPPAKTASAEEIPAPEPDVAQAPKPEASPAPDIAATGMRWPVRGKIISGYGAKPNGLKNEGINIAVPEGTSVRAAESGVVAYSGNELKGYGNLVLIRHEGGWVTAYAHAKELFVKRGDTVKRGDVIAKAGQTGSVSSPQLHFEVRKGATAMDPTKFLSNATASN